MNSSLSLNPRIPMKLFLAPQAFLTASLLIGAGSTIPVPAQANDMFPTKAAAQQRAKELKCSGAFPMGKEWMPCKDFATYAQAVSKEP